MQYHGRNGEGPQHVRPRRRIAAALPTYPQRPPRVEAGSAGLAVGLDISSHYMPGVIDLLALRVVPWKTGFFLFGVILGLSGDGVGMGTFASEESESR